MFQGPIGPLRAYITVTADAAPAKRWWWSKPVPATLRIEWYDETGEHYKSVQFASEQKANLAAGEAVSMLAAGRVPDDLHVLYQLAVAL